MKKQSGQIILLLILVMTVGLAIGLSIVQKSLIDVSTASKVEQSSRAFSAAEAGVEKALNSSSSTSCTDCQSFSENNSIIKQVVDLAALPPLPNVNTPQEVLEFPPLAKEEVAQVWLADYTSPTNPPPAFYNQNSLDIFWGNSTTDRPALELTMVYYNGTSYTSRKWYLDQTNRSNGFCQISTCNGGYRAGANTYQCSFRLGGNAGCINGVSIDNSPLPSSSPNVLMLARFRLLYNSTSQPFAVQAVGARGLGSCASGGCWLPAQARSITSTGIAGETQRRVNLFQFNNVVPSYFDYAIFSSGEINK